MRWRIGVTITLVLTLVVAAAALHGFGRRGAPAPAGQVVRAAPDATAGSSAVPTGDSRPMPPPPAMRVTVVELKRGDTLLGALAREGVDPSVGATVAAALAEHGANLRRVKPDHALEVTWNPEGDPIAVNYMPSPWLGFAAVATDTGWAVRRAETSPDVRVEPVTGEVGRSLFEGVESAGESPQLAIDLAEIFGSEFDFTADTRPGDRFRLLVEKRYADDAFIDYGRIVVAQYRSDGRMLTGVGFRTAGSGFGYYDLDGRSLRKSFLKSPLEFTRITSGFTYARPHPILGGVRPHLAIDYAAPLGTPVRAVADGRVVSAGWNGDNGISVRLEHHAGYETMYNHLSRVAARVSPGARVGQRQVIGYVGATGLATGPHLDYRVAHAGRFVNPLGERFLPGEPIPASARAEFVQRAGTLVRELQAAASF
jgi:murein DD-endopeptidase MepM/ murein hydrolase activator NlpD